MEEQQEDTAMGFSGVGAATEEHEVNASNKKKRRMETDPPAVRLLPSYNNTQSISDYERTIKTLEAENQQLCEKLGTLKDIASRALLDRIYSWNEETIHKAWVHDRKLVVAAVGANKTDWLSLPAALQSDPDVVMAEIYGSSRLSRSRYPTWDELPQTCRSNPDIILASLECEGRHCSFSIQWTDVPTDIKQTNKEVALFGVKRRSLDPDTFPCLLDREFLKEKINSDSLRWGQLPTVFRTDVDFARSF